jgi:hypothetical protein
MGRHVPVIAALLGLALAGCSFKGPRPLQAFKPLDETDSVLAVDEASYKLVAMSQLQAERQKDGRLQLVVELNNLSAQDLSIQVQTVFRNQEGSLYGDETNWEMIVLPGGGDYRYEVTSLQPQADTYRIQVRTP